MIDIYTRRKELNLTLEKVAHFVGVSKSTVKKWEDGYIKNMRRDKIERLAAVLRVSPLEFLNIDTPIPPQLPASSLSDDLATTLDEVLTKAFNQKMQDSFALIIKDKKIFLANSQTHQLKLILDIIK